MVYVLEVSLTPLSPVDYESETKRGEPLLVLNREIHVGDLEELKEVLERLLQFSCVLAQEYQYQHSE